MSSRQERRKAERDAAKRAPARAGVAGAAGANQGAAGAAAAALANLHVNVNPPLGDWTTQARDPYVLLRALDPQIVKQRAAAGDRDAQYSLGCVLVGEAGGVGVSLGAGGRSPKSDEGLALLEKAAGQGHAYAMFALGSIHRERKEYEQDVEWFTKAAEAGLPEAMVNLAWSLAKGKGVAAPESLAAMDWYRRAADAGHGGAVRVESS